MSLLEQRQYNFCLAPFRWLFDDTWPMERRKYSMIIPSNGPELRIVSLLPSATESVWALGLDKELVGRSHGCDYPKPVKDKPAVLRCIMPVEEMTPAEIDLETRQRLKACQSLYQIDRKLLFKLAPTHILVQDLCQVCAPTIRELDEILRLWPYRPNIIQMSPHTIADIYKDFRRLGKVTGKEQEAEWLIAENLRRLESISGVVESLDHRPKVFCLEWLDPLFSCGHWIPEMVTWAGGSHCLGHPGSDSVRITVEDIVHADPEIILVMPCGYDLCRAAEQARIFLEHTMIQSVSAVESGRVFAVDPSLFTRPGLRILEGIECMAQLFHPDVFLRSSLDECCQQIVLD